MKIDNSMNFFVGDTAATKILLGSTLLWPLVFLYNKITYTSTDGNVITPYKTTGFGANIVSNEYKDGIGVITFDKDITKIPSSAFSDISKVSLIDIPEGVTTIGYKSFYNCDALKTIIIPASVTEIDRAAFGDCSILNTYFKSLIPADIYDDSFSPFNTNRRIYVPYSAMITYKNVPYWSDYASYIVGYNFETNTTVTDINTIYSTNKQILYTSSDNKVVTPHRPTEFGGANIVSNEYNNGMGVITFDKDVTEIGFGAFWECESLTAIKIPYTVSSIEEGAFGGCESLMYINLNNVTTIRVTAFDSCISLTNIHIPDNVTTLESGAFTNNNIKVFTGKFAGRDVSTTVYERYLLDESTHTLLGYANDSGTEFTTDVLHIGRLAFSGCDKLTSITMNNVFSIGESAFSGCNALKSVYCNKTSVPTGGNDMFHDTSPDLVIYVPENRVDAYKNAEYWSDYADAIRGYNF